MSATLPKSEPQGRFPALAVPDFRRFWVGQFISNAGSHMQNTALNWHLYLLTGSPVALGMLGLVRFIPVITLSLVGGALADACNRRRVMLVTQSVLMVNAAILGWLTMTGHITATAIYVLTALNATAMAFDSPARQALVANLVPREVFANAVSMNQTLFQVATIGGPMIAGVLIGAGGIATTYWLNSLSFVAVLIALLTIRTSGGKGETTPVTVTALREGLAFVRSMPVVMGLMILDAVATFFSSANTLLPVFAKEVLHVGPRGYGVLSAAPAVGSFTAAAAVALLPSIRRQGRAVLLAVVVHGAATLGFGLSPWFALSCAMLALAGGADTVSAILRQTIRQLVTPDRLRGRVSAINMVFFMGGPRLGEVEAGLVAGWLGAPVSVITGGLGCILTAAAVGRLFPAMRRYVPKGETRD